MCPPNYFYLMLTFDNWLATKQGEFEMTGTDTLDRGVYFLLTLPSKDYIQFFVNGIDNEFEAEWDLKKRGNKGCFFN